MLRLIIISGRSGSGKSTALHVLEDMGYYCIDNLPVRLLPSLVNNAEGHAATRIAVSVDARNIAVDLKQFPEMIESFDSSIVEYQIVYLDSAGPTLVQRFSETRRKHPLTDPDRGLREALEFEKELLEPIASMAALVIDTTTLTMHQLRDLIRSRVVQESFRFALMFQSFAYKNGVPVDADLVFDVRCLPNPHWKPALRSLTGLDIAVQEFLAAEEDFIALHHDIKRYLEIWLPKFEENNRSYMTIAIGCTGGQHRSVYLCEKLTAEFSSQWDNVQVRHRELIHLRQEPVKFD